MLVEEMFEVFKIAKTMVKTNQSIIRTVDKNWWFFDGSKW